MTREACQDMLKQLNWDYRGDGSEVENQVANGVLGSKSGK